MTDQTKAVPCIAGQPRREKTCGYCGSSGVQPCTGLPFVDEFAAELRARKAEHEAAQAERVASPRPVFRVRLTQVDRWTHMPASAEYDYVRYADAAAHFWGFVQLQPDDGWDFYGGTERPADLNPYAMERRGRDFTRADAPWRVVLEVIG
jgi:hypothetical protein